MNLDGKVAIITGSGGLATDEALFGRIMVWSPRAVCSHILQ
jgi:hypothetical protein